MYKLMQTMINLTLLYIKKHISNYSCILNYKSEWPHRYRIAIIKNLSNRAKLISSSDRIFYYELKNIKQSLINNGFQNYFVDEQIKLMIKNKNKINEKVMLHKIITIILNHFIVIKWIRTLD